MSERVVTAERQSAQPTSGAVLQRRCACGQPIMAGGECAACRKKRVERERSGRLQRRAVTDHAPEVAPPIVYDVLRSPGRPLDEGTRGFMESRFGHDFSGVRVHTDARAGQSARAVNAHAYTVGQDVVFGVGQYRPRTSAGQRLLAHELAHTVQQENTPSLMRSDLQVAPASNIYEQQADRAADSVAQGKPVPPDLSPATAPAVQRACGAAAIGTPAGCTPLTSDPVGELILFTPNCDTFVSPAEQTRVEEFADSVTATDKVKVHGFASLDGPADYNDHLSCARALTAAGILRARGIAPGQIEVFKHGEVAGPPAERRSVVLERDPATSRPIVPQLIPSIAAGPTPGVCGVMDFVTRWQISRNASPRGGFVVQDLTITWDNRDCAGNEVPDATGKVSPLHYFEAWRVLPGSTTFDAADGDTDHFVWVNDDPSGCTTDRVTFTGVARYHDDVAVADMPAHMTRFNSNTFAGGLRASLTDPALGGNVSRPVDHSLRFSWDCCPCQSSLTVVEQHTP